MGVQTDPHILRHNLVLRFVRVRKLSVDLRRRAEPSRSVFFPGLQVPVIAYDLQKSHDPDHQAYKNALPCDLCDAERKRMKQCLLQLVGYRIERDSLTVQKPDAVSDIDDKRKKAQEK